MPTELSNELKQNSDIEIFYNKITEVLNSENLEPELNRIVEVIKKQASLDDLNSDDWGIIYESAKSNL